MLGRVCRSLVIAALAVLVSACQFRAPEPERLPEPVATTTLSSATMVPSATVTPTTNPTPSPPSDLVTLLRDNPMPPADPEALARSMLAGLKEPTAETVKELATVGDSRQFWMADIDQVSYRSITATLLVSMEHIQMWVEDGAPVDYDGLARSARMFNDTIYPTVRKGFGSEWTPGIDGDPRLVVLNGTFSGAAGYFASANELTQAANPFSNGAEMFVMNLAALYPGTDRYDSTLAHEFQHMIHWHQDSNEAAWVNEGASQLAEELAGYDPPRGHIASYAATPDTQLTTWSDDGAASAHYGASYLFVRYLSERMGQDAVRDLISEAGDGLQGLDAVLSRMNGPTADELLADWFVALLGADADDTRYTLGGIEANLAITSVDELPNEFDVTVAQHGVDYYALPPDTRLKVLFEGDAQARLLDNAPAGGQYQWWSNRGDSGHSSLRREVDLTGVTAATLRYDVWHDIELGWDYAHLRVSNDGGANWALLHAPHMSDYDPVGNALGMGYTGASGAPPDVYDQDPTWVHEEVDLGAFAGHVIQISLDYFTDDAVNYQGLCVDNWGIDAVGWSDDAEDADPGWQSQGFIRHDNTLSQRYSVSLVEMDADGVSVRDLGVDSEGRGSWRIETFPEPTRSILLVAGMTRGTTIPASYTLGVEDLAQP